MVVVSNRVVVSQILIDDSSLAITATEFSEPNLIIQRQSCMLATGGAHERPWQTAGDQTSIRITLLVFCMQLCRCRWADHTRRPGAPEHYPELKWWEACPPSCNIAGLLKASSWDKLILVPQAHNKVVNFKLASWIWQGESRGQCQCFRWYLGNRYYQINTAAIHEIDYFFETKKLIMHQINQLSLKTVLH